MKIIRPDEEAHVQTVAPGGGTRLACALLAACLAPCGAADEYLLFDVRTKFNADYVKSAFSQVDVRHMFKVIRPSSSGDITKQG